MSWNSPRVNRCKVCREIVRPVIAGSADCLVRTAGAKFFCNRMVEVITDSSRCALSADGTRSQQIGAHYLTKSDDAERSAAQIETA